MEHTSHQGPVSQSAPVLTDMKKRHHDSSRAHRSGYSVTIDETPRHPGPGTRHQPPGGYRRRDGHRYNTMSSVTTRKSALSRSSRYPEFRERTKSAPPLRRYRSRSEDASMYRNRRRSSASPRNLLINLSHLLYELLIKDYKM